MNPSAVSQNSTSQDAFLSDVFHELSQPLTALHCLLELSLQRDTTADELRASLEKALDNADRLRQRLILMRAIYYTDQTSLAGHTAELNKVLRELQEDMLPVFASTGQELRIELLPSKVLVKGDPCQLAGALFYCLEYLLRYSHSQDATSIRICVSEPGIVEIRIHSRASLPVAASNTEAVPSNSFELELARRTFQAAGGNLQLMRNGTSGFVCLGTLSLA